MSRMGKVYILLLNDRCSKRSKTNSSLRNVSRNSISKYVLIKCKSGLWHFCVLLNDTTPPVLTRVTRHLKYILWIQKLIQGVTGLKSTLSPTLFERLGSTRGSLCYVQISLFWRNLEVLTQNKKLLTSVF